MSARTASPAIVSAPIRIGPSLVAAFTALIAVLLAVRPDMMMTLVRGIMGGI